MNNRNRHMQYRRSIYRKKRAPAVIIISIVGVVLAFVLFIILGNVLHSKTKEPDGYQYDDPPKVTDSSSILPAEIVGAYALPLLEDGSLFSSRLEAIDPTANAVCINLNKPDGTLLYKSDLAESLPNLTVASDASSLSSSLSSISKDGFYTSGVLYLSSLDTENDLLLDIDLSVSGAVACEAIRAGVGDVLLIAPSFEENDIEKLCLLADRIHTTESDAVIGLLISDSVISAENSIALIDRLNKHFNYLCVDTTDNEETEISEHIGNRIKTMQSYILQHKMRVLLPRSLDSEVQKQYVEIANSYGVASWQILP